MNTLRQFTLIVLATLVTASRSACAAPPVIPDERDRQVLDTLLLYLLADPKFDMTRAIPKGTTMVLDARTPEKTGFLWASQMRGDIRKHTLPEDAAQDLRSRNTPADAKPDSYAAVAASFTDLKFSAGIVVEDLEAALKDRHSFRAFEETHPTARGHLTPYLPGYSKEGNQAIVRAYAGPSPHGATVTALLEKSGEKWIVKWHHVAFYV